MNSKNVLIPLFFLLFGLAAPVSAELIYGEVQSVDAQNSQIQLKPLKAPEDVTAKQIKLNVDQSKIQKSARMGSLEDLAVGERIVVEADRRAEGQTQNPEWAVQSILTEKQLNMGQQKYSEEKTIRAGVPAQGIRYGVEDKPASTT